jgi:hypothetical protein
MAHGSLYEAFTFIETQIFSQWNILWLVAADPAQVEAVEVEAV